MIVSIFTMCFHNGHHNGICYLHNVSQFQVYCHRDECDQFAEVIFPERYMQDIRESDYFVYQGQVRTKSGQMCNSVLFFDVEAEEQVPIDLTGDGTESEDASDDERNGLCDGTCQVPNSQRDLRCEFCGAWMRDCKGHPSDTKPLHLHCMACGKKVDPKGHENSDE